MTEPSDTKVLVLSEFKPCLKLQSSLPQRLTYLFERLRLSKNKRRNTELSSGQLPRWLPRPGLGLAKAKCQELHLDTPCAGQEPQTLRPSSTACPRSQQGVGLVGHKWGPIWDACVISSTSNSILQCQPLSSSFMNFRF